MNRNSIKIYDSVTVVEYEAYASDIFWTIDAGAVTKALISDGNALAVEIRCAGEAKKIKDIDKRWNRAKARKEREELLRKQAELEAEINRLYPIPKKIKNDSRIIENSTCEDE